MNMVDTLHWAQPEALWLFVPWAVWLAFMLRGELRRPKGAANDATEASAATALTASPWSGIVDPALLPHLAAGGERDRGGASSSLSPVWLPALAALLLLALAGPQADRPSGGAMKPPLRPDTARVVVVDLSPSFAALGEAQAVAARADLMRFLRALPPGETALVIAAGRAWLVVPPTEDVAALDAFVAELSAAAVPPAARGSRPEAALSLARATLAATGAAHQEIAWFGAGEPPAFPVATAPGPGTASTASAPVMPVFLRFGAGVEDWIARFGPAGASSTAGWTIARSNRGADAGRVDLGPVLLLVALPVLAFLIGGSVRRHAVVVVAAMATGAFTVPPAGATDDAFAAGVAHYRAGRFSEAAAAFRTPAAQAVDAARAQHNLGNALARGGQLREALAAYDQSLRLRPDDADTRFNRDLVARLLNPPDKPPPKSGATPPPPSQSPQPPQSAEAERAAAQWLRRPPGDAAGLLARKLALEESRPARH
jgi:Ca-activated chloride channel family protein